MTTLVIAAAIFTFQNNFWVNLHQFLHTEANRRASGRALQMDAALVEGAFDFRRFEACDAGADVIDPAGWLTLGRRSDRDVGGAGGDGEGPTAFRVAWR